jgi:hypothetical protein
MIVFFEIPINRGQDAAATAQCGKFAILAPKKRTLASSFASCHSWKIRDLFPNSTPAPLRGLRWVRLAAGRFAALHTRLFKYDRNAVGSDGTCQMSPPRGRENGKRWGSRLCRSTHPTRHGPNTRPFTAEITEAAEADGCKQRSEQRLSLLFVRSIQVSGLIDRSQQTPAQEDRYNATRQTQDREFFGQDPQIGYRGHVAA